MDLQGTQGKRLVLDQEEHGEIDIIYFDGVHLNPHNGLDECKPGGRYFEEAYGDVQWYGPIKPPK